MRKLFLLLWGLSLPLWPMVAQNRSVAKPINNTAGDLKGVALVIGNWKYPDNPLKNPENDAKDMAELFRQLGYEVIYYENLSTEGMEKAHSEFINRLGNNNKVGVFYFAGHGFESQKDNTHYLNSVEMRKYHTLNQGIEKSLSLATLWSDMTTTNPKGTNLLFIDACRIYKDRSWTRDGNYKGNKVDAPRGTLAFFAASPGQAASENAGQRNGLFTQELKKQLSQPNLEIYDLVRNTANEVFTKNDEQAPYWSGNLYGKFYLNPQNIPPPDPNEEAKRLQAEKDAEIARLKKELAKTSPPAPEGGVKKKFLDLPFAEMVYVEGGRFEMGSNKGYDDEKPVHIVTVSSFLMGKYEVTQAQWRAVMGSDPPELYNKNCDDCPVDGVSWNDIQEFLQKLNARSGGNYRLPTEAEWEYAARGGKNWRDGYTYAGGNTLETMGWFEANYQDSKHGEQGTTHPVGKKLANQLGIHDLSGNVWEWCSDWYSDNWYAQAAASQSNPENKDFGSKTNRVLRGGSWTYAPNFACVAYRYNSPPGTRNGNYGFRLVSQF